MSTDVIGKVVEECTNFVWNSATWIQSKGGGFPNANGWLTWARAKGFNTASQPAAGDIVVYAANGANGTYSSVGHVAVVDQVFSNGTFSVSESNFASTSNPHGLPQSGRVSTMAGVEGFITPPGGASPATSAAPIGINSYQINGTGHLSLSQAMTGGSGIEGAVSGFSTWVGQSTVRNTILLGLAGTVLILVGLKFLGHPEPIRIITAGKVS